MADEKRPKRGKEAADERILIALSCGATAAAAAREAGVGTRTVERRLADPAFRARLHQLRTETLERTGGALIAAGLRAVQTLLSLQDVSQPAPVRLGAAKALVELGLKTFQLIEIGQRMTEMNARVDELTAKLQ
jgi:hypothetical protein